MSKLEIKVREGVNGHLESMMVILHNISDVVKVSKAAEQELGEPVAKFRVRAEELQCEFTDNHKRVLELGNKAASVAAGMDVGAIPAVEQNTELFKGDMEKLSAAMDASHAINQRTLKLVDEMRADPLLKDKLTAQYSVPGATNRPTLATPSTGYVPKLSDRKKFEINHPYELIDFLAANSSNSPIKNIQREIGMTVINSATASGRPGDGLAVSAVFTPGSARVFLNGTYQFVKGFQWEIAATTGRDESDALPHVFVKCFMSVNDRNMFNRLYTKEEGTAVDKLYTEFTPESTVNASLH